MSLYAEHDTLKAMIGDDSDDEGPTGIYEIEETSQELIHHWSNSPRYPLSNAGWRHSGDPTSTFKRHNTSHLRTSSVEKDADLSDLSSAFQRSTNNLFGRDISDASSDFLRLIRPQRSERNVTPSLTSDDTTSPSSCGFRSPITVPRDLAPLSVPNEPPSPVNVTEPVVPETPDHPQDAVVSTTPTTGPEPMELYPNVQIMHAAPSPSHAEERSVQASAPLTKLPTLAIGQTTDNAYNWDFSSLSTATNIAIDETLPAPSSRAQTFEADMTNAMACTDNNEERDELLDDNDGDEDTYIPEEKPQQGRQRQKTKKSSGSFKCRFCTAVFTRNFDMLRHIKSVHETATVDKKLSRTCPCCGAVLSRNDAFKRHITKVPSSCHRYAKLQGKEEPPSYPQAFYDLCTSGKPPCPGEWSPLPVEAQAPPISLQVAPI